MLPPVQPPGRPGCSERHRAGQNDRPDQEPGRQGRPEILRRTGEDVMEFLLEINTEEMPAPHVKAGLSQLKEKIERELQANHIMCHSLETYGTCRRLVAIGDFAPKQEDREEVIIGPPKAVAFAADGSPAQAAIGFARSQHAEVGKLQGIPPPRGEYVGLKKITKGRPN